jgi:hypothetical protein
MAEQAETAPTPAELGHLVKGLDFSGVVEYAKGQHIPGYESLDDMIGSLPITIDGLTATVGWVNPRSFQSVDYPQDETPPIEVENPGGEDVIVVEGGLSALVQEPSLPHTNRLHAAASGNRPGFMQFDGGDTIRLIPFDQEVCWYVCFYPEQPASAEAPGTPEAS